MLIVCILFIETASFTLLFVVARHLPCFNIIVQLLLYSVSRVSDPDPHYFRASKYNLFFSGKIFSIFCHQHPGSGTGSWSWSELNHCGSESLLNAVLKLLKLGILFELLEITMIFSVAYKSTTYVCRALPLCLSEEADSGTQQTHHPAWGHSPYRAPCTGSQGRLSCQYSYRSGSPVLYSYPFVIHSPITIQSFAFRTSSEAFVLVWDSTVGAVETHIIAQDAYCGALMDLYTSGWRFASLEKVISNSNPHQVKSRIRSLNYLLLSK